jgi:phage regulator Rha-like protein
MENILKVINEEKPVVITSLQLARLSGRKHFHMMRDIELYILDKTSQYHNPNLDADSDILEKYVVRYEKDNQKRYKMLALPTELALEFMCSINAKVGVALCRSFFSGQTEAL